MRVKNKHTFKAKWAVYYLLGWVVVLVFASWGYQGARANWMISAASIELKETRAAMAPAQEANAKLTQLEEVNSLLASEASKAGRPVVVNLINDGSAKSKAMFRARAKWGDEHLASFENLLTHESGFNPNIYNKKSGACGLFQALPCTKMTSMDIDDQITWGLNYIAQRYGNPTNAWNHWLAAVPINGKNHGHWY